MSMQVVGTKTAPDTYRFDITGTDGARPVTVDYGDGSAIDTINTAADGTGSRSHTYTTPGHHTYTAVFTAPKTAYAATLAELAAAGQVNDSMFAAVPDGGPFDSNRETGHRFTVNTAGVVRAIRYGRTSTNPVTARQVNLWDGTTQALLASAQTAGEAGGGWLTAALKPAVPVAAGRQYVASYNSRDRSPVVQPIPAGAAAHLTSVNPVNNNTGANLFPSAVGTSFTFADVIFSPYGGTLATLAATPGLSTLGAIAATTERVTVPVTVDVGPATLNATVKAADPVPQVQLDVWIGNPASVGSWVVERITPDEVVPIRIQTGPGAAETFIDYLAPVGVPLTYRLTVTYTNPATSPYSVSTEPIVITGTEGCYVTNPATGATLRVTLATWPQQTYAERQAVLEVLARPDPVVLSDVHSTAAGEWTFYTTTDAQRRALLDLLRAQRIVVLRTQPTSSIDTVTAAVGKIVERRFSGYGGDQRRWIEVEHQVIASLPAITLPWPATLDGLHRQVPGTLADLNGLRPTLLQLSMVETG